MTSDTIFARASGAGRAGVAVWRLSGPAARKIAALLSQRTIKTRAPALSDILDPQTGEAIDKGLVLAFEGPASFTGEDVVEFHLHGSRAVEAAFAEACVKAGARPAEAGEFARRAFLNGKMDLAEIEGLSDLIEAETSAQRKAALGQLGGRLSARAEGWNKRLVAALAPLEAAIDFPDEEGVPAEIAVRAAPAISALLGELRECLEGAASARRLREGVDVAIIGAPNAGKSSLLNALAGSDVAIVSPTPGTTRDVIEVRLDLEGLAVILADTAGLRGAPGDAIEQEGMARALARAERADLRVLVIDPRAGDAAEPPAVFQQGSDLLVWSKADLGGPSRQGVYRLSAKTGAGIPEFLAALAEKSRDLAGGSEAAGLTRARHARAVAQATRALERAETRLAAPELAAEDVRLAARALSSLTGAVDVEDVLGEIFASFCIGK